MFGSFFKAFSKKNKVFGGPCIIKINLKWRKVAVFIRFPFSSEIIWYFDADCWNFNLGPHESNPRHLEQNELWKKNSPVTSSQQISDKNSEGI